MKHLVGLAKLKSARPGFGHRRAELHEMDATALPIRKTRTRFHRAGTHFASPCYLSHKIVICHRRDDERIEAAMQFQGAATTLDPVSRDFYQSAIRYLQAAAVPFLVGGAYSFARHTGLERHTKDFDIFVRPADCERVLQTLAGAGYSVELTFPHWLGKAFSGDNCIDVIYSSGNGIARVDDDWFTHAVEGRVFDTPVLLCPVEETIWSKSFIMERERFDGADIAHLIRGSGRNIHWQRLLDRFGPHWRVLLTHLVMFGFIYPGERDTIPVWVLHQLMNQLHGEATTAPSRERVCQGTVLSRAQYLVDIEHWGYEDARVAAGHMHESEIVLWTDAIATEQPTPATRPMFRSE
jgi:hypothetical protein